MNLTLEALQILDMIDRKGSFAAAALALDRVPSALTYSVRKLEDDLDVLLFDRRGHRAKLTPAGHELLTEGRHLLHAADDLEQRVKRTATGRETELRIVINSIIPFSTMLPLIAAFDREGGGTKLRFTPGVLSGTWEEMMAGRADLVIGATLDGPEIVRTSGWVGDAPEPLSPELVRRHRAVAVGDSSRSHPGITMGLLDGQETLTVPSVEAKLAAQLAGLGCGHLPRFWAAPYLASGALIEKQTIMSKPHENFLVAWPKAEQGKSLKWFLQHLAQADVQHALLGIVPATLQP